MVSIYEAQQIMLESVKSLERVEVIPIEVGEGRVLAIDIKAPFDMPKFDNSAMDGYGIKLRDSGEIVKVKKRELAGDKSSSINYGEAIKIMTGAKVDSSIEAVVPIEFIEKIDDNSIKLPLDIKKEANIRKKGEEFRKGDILIKRGEVLDASKIALIAGLGITHIEVFEKVKVLVISTGNEIKNHYETINPYQHFNSSALFFKMEKLAEVTLLPIVGDRIEEIKNRINEHYDLIITTGGVSKGDADFTTAAFRQSGYEIKFSWIAIKPGKPFGFAVKKNKVATLLTGNPLAAVFNYNLFVKPLIRKMAGCSSYYIDFVELPTSNSLKRKAGRDEVIPATIVDSKVVLSSKRGSGMISVLSESEGITILNRSKWEVVKEEKIKFIDFSKWSKQFKGFVNE
jgi:molybdopterin molybdotransferase